MIMTIEQYNGLQNATGRSVGQVDNTKDKGGTNKLIKLWSEPVTDFEHYWGHCAGEKNGKMCKGVPFLIHVKRGDNPGIETSFTENQWKKIRLAMNEVEEDTCIR